MHTRSVRTAGGLMIAAAVLANVCFALLGSRFNYPDILREPATNILRQFHSDVGPVALLFAGLAAASALLIPIAWFSRHLLGPAPTRVRRIMVTAGIAAGMVQVVGLLRWPLFVPRLAAVVANPATKADARSNAIDTFQTLHTYLGGLVGEAFGYALTAIWTVAMVTGVVRRPGRWFAPLGIASAILIAMGLLEPLGIALAGLANFVGYIVWSLWVVTFGIWLLRHPDAEAAFGRTTVSDRSR